MGPIRSNNTFGAAGIAFPVLPAPVQAARAAEAWEYGAALGQLGLDRGAGGCFGLSFSHIVSPQKGVPRFSHLHVARSAAAPPYRVPVPNCKARSFIE